MTKAQKRAHDKYINNNREKVNQHAREYRKRNKKWIKVKNRWRKLKARHGITKRQYLVLLEKQKGKCGICRKILKHNLAVDHNHKTNMIRGLLCHKCNMALGTFEYILNDVKKYLSKHAGIKWVGILRMK